MTALPSGATGLGAYALTIDLPGPLALEIPRFRGACLPAGRYVYCGSAYGPGGLAARIARHRRPEKPRRWHIDHLTAAGRIGAVVSVPGGCECALVARLLALPGTTVPLTGFGNSDCRACPAHLAAVPKDFTVRRLRVRVPPPARAG